MSFIKNIKKFLFPRMGVIIENVETNNQNFSDLLFKSCQTENNLNAFYMHLPKYLLLRNLFKIEDYNSNYKLPTDIKELALSHLNNHYKRITECNFTKCEGSLITYKDKVNDLLISKPGNIFMAAQYVLKEFKKIEALEIGFNLGYGANLLLSVDNNSNFCGVDIGYHAYINSAAKIVKEDFPDRNFELIIEDSKSALKKLHKNGRKFNLIHVDGSHSYEDVKEDLKNSNNLLEINGILILDDVSGDGVAKSIYEWDSKDNYEVFNKQEYIGLHPHLILKKIK